MLHTQIAARHRQNWHPLTPIHDPGGRKNSIWGLLFLSGGQYPRTSGGSCAAIRMACSAPPLQPQPSAANATQDVGLYNTLCREVLLFGAKKLVSSAKTISMRKFSDLKSMPRTVGSPRLRAVQLRRPLSPSREAHVFDRPPLTQRTLMGVDDPRFPQGRGRCCSRSWRVDFKVEIITPRSPRRRRRQTKQAKARKARRLGSWSGSANDVGLAATRGRRQRGKRYRNIRIQACYCVPMICVFAPVVEADAYCLLATLNLR